MGHRHSQLEATPVKNRRLSSRGLGREKGPVKPASAASSDLWSPPSYDSHFAPRPPVLAPDDSAYAFLGEFDTIFVVDDSSSMTGRRWKEAEDAIAAIAPVCTRYDQDGIDIYFLNHRREATRATTGAYMNITTADDVREIFNSVHPRGPTPFGKRLHDILTLYLRRVDMMEATGIGGCSMDPFQVVKPLNIIAITDGAFTDDAESVIVDVARRLDDCRAAPWQVGIQFFQIGDDAQAQSYLQALDDELGRLTRHDHLRDIVDTVPWRGRSGQTLSAEGILKCVLGAVNRKYDKCDQFR
ncbi:hypothetical protein EYZ11_002732 [Aspergillus tanneri]|uniref:VWFA domain-containing protein n=1 Tax=Aspergillus tanneri TaxID=1220188 RepID=A0A4S3JQ67_9EURO|nr:uncharacterized protein ATNIH1004_000397 [Aspergillus tanneri]KAA8651509.1 hypothetical protein ATNIH1004_000397 [Aspergillus tanneri]THC97816.1 hypothetical protein EYZ11_002732 [Aspergillus tanneri]